LFIVEPVNKSSQKESKDILEKRCGESKVESFELSFGSVLPGVVRIEQSFHNETKVDIGSIDPSNSDGELNRSEVED